MQAIHTLRGLDVGEALFSTNELQAIQDDLAIAATALSAIPAIGGSLWDRTTTGAGDGIHTKPGDTAAGQVVGNVYAQLPPVIALSEAGATIPVARWYFIGDDQNTLLTGDKITSVVSSALVFAVSSINIQPGYIIAGLTQANGRRL